jgi:tripartite-type tricarboxylate transporter receptor subunit TctC
MKRALSCLLGLTALVAVAPVAAASDYPNKPITMILGFAPGGPSDVMARVLTKKMEEVLRQPVVIENKAGAGGTIAGGITARAAPDGYTIMLASGSILAINVTLYKNAPYDSVKDFAPVSMLGVQTNVLYTHPSVPAKNVAEFVAYAKANPGKLSFGSGGVGTPAHLAGELFRIKAGIDYTHVPFRGSGPTVQSVIGNHVPTAFNPPAPLIPHIASGSIKAIAITTLERTPVLPDTPTFHESGYPGFDAATWHAVVAPAGTPQAVVAALNKAITIALDDATVRKALADSGVDVKGSTPEWLADYIKSEIPKWAEVVKASGAKAE